MPLFVALLLASTDATATQPVIAPQVTTPVPAPKAKEKKVCRMEDSDVGSHRVRRVCRSADEADQQPNYGIGHSGTSISGDKFGQH